MAAAARRPEPIFRAMGTTFKSITEGTFNSVGAEYRPAPWKPKRDGTPSILQKSTTLAKSFQLQVSNTYARLSNPTRYAAIHQFGGTIHGHPWLRMKWGPGARDWATVGQVVMPARPFFPVLNGKLTPAAEEKIARAGQRAAQRQFAGET